MNYAKMNDIGFESYPFWAEASETAENDEAGTLLEVRPVDTKAAVALLRLSGDPTKGRGLYFTAVLYRGDHGRLYFGDGRYDLKFDEACANYESRIVAAEQRAALSRRLRP